MNSGGFPNIQGGRPPQQIHQQNGGMQRNGGTSSDIQNHILTVLHSQQVPPGWQQTVNPKHRAVTIHQMVTGLRIVKPDMSLQYAISVATGFEMQQFSISPDQESYNQSWRQKLLEIQATRQNQANMQQQQLQNQQAAQMGLTPQQMQARGMMNGPGQFQPGIGMPQPQQPAQALGVPMQQQLSQNQRLMQNGNPTDIQQPIQSGQPMQNMARPGPPNRGQPQFTPEENQHISNLARQMMARMTDQDRANILRRLSTTLPEQQQHAMRAQGIDPITAFIRSQAIQTFANEKQKRLQMTGQGLPPSANGAMPTQGRPISQVSMHNSQQPHPPPTTQQQPEPSFGVGNLDQFVGQQQEGLRHQAAGQDVVPASNSQAGPPQIRGTPHQPPQGQFPPNRPMQPPNFPSQPQPQWNGPQNQQPNVQQTGHIPMQPPSSNFANMQGQQTPQQQALQGQLGGLSNNHGQRTPQHHNMPTLNQPMDPPKPVNNDTTQRQSQATPKQGQQNRPNGQPATANNAQPNPSQSGQALGSFWAKLPLQIQQSLQRMPEEQRRKLFQQKMKAAAEARKSGNAQDSAQPGPQGPVNGTKVGPASNTQQANNAQSTPTTNSAGPQSGGNSFARVNAIQQPGSQQGPQDPNRPAPPKMGPMRLTEAQARYMDSQPFPTQILNKNNSLGQLPENVKTWGHLKEYVQQRAQSLPPGSMQNVVGLQSIHMQQMQATTANKQRIQQFQAMKQGSIPPGQTGQAPQAPPMVPPQPNQAPLTSNAPPGQFSLPQLPQPTMQEIVSARATLPENMKGIPDGQLRAMIVQRRQQEFLKANQQKLNPQQQQQIQRNNFLNAQRMNAQQGQLPMGQNQLTQIQQTTRGQAQPTQSAQQLTQPPPPKQSAGLQGRQPPPNQQGHGPQAGQKGAKRLTNDDVVEVPDPKTQQQPRPPNSRPGQPFQMAGTQQMTQETFARLSNEHKAQVQAKMREAQNLQHAKLASTGPTASAQASAPADSHDVGQNAGQNTQRDNAFQALIAEVAKSTPTRPPVPMSPKTRTQMIEKLKDNTASMVHRIEQSLPVFLRMSGDLNQARELLRMRLLLLRQVQDTKFENPVENFTMTIQELDDYKNKLSNYFISMLNAAAGAQPPTGQPQQLNAKNLQQQQAIFSAARVASAHQKNQANSSSRAPPAPTATHAPFKFGSQSPQGVPQIYALKNELTQENLKLPQPKKRKHNQPTSAASTPAQIINTPVTKSSPAAKVDSPEVQRAPVVPNMMKCAVSDCESGKMGFATKEELEKHRMEVHEPKEPAIKDPLDAAAYAIESLRIALNLDENGNPKPVVLSKDDQVSSKEDKGILQAPAMKASASAQSHTIKQEVATPMSRNPTQTGPSPSSNLLRTPQATATMKTPASDAKSAAKDAGAKAPAAKSPPAAAPNPWTNSHVKPEWFKEVFSDVANLNRTVPDDFITGWLERNPFTPPTSPSSGAIDKDSPHKSDISANDNININLAASGEDWLPSEWFDDGLRGDMEALDVGDLMDMNWDTTLGEEEEVLGKGKRRRDPMEPSDEWLKAWAPEKYEEKTKRDAQKKR